MRREAMATTNVQPIPDGYRTFTPYVTVADGDAVIAFMQQAFDAKVLERLNHDNGRLMHAEVQIGDSRLMLSQGNGQHPPMPCALYLYLPDVDATCRRATPAVSGPRRPDRRPQPPPPCRSARP